MIDSFPPKKNKQNNLLKQSINSYTYIIQKTDKKILVQTFRLSETDGARSSRLFDQISRHRGRHEWPGVDRPSLSLFYESISLARWRTFTNAYMRAPLTGSSIVVCQSPLSCTTCLHRQLLF